MAYIYMIVRSDTEECYVGHTSMHYGERWKAHRYHLNKGDHHSQHLQRAWAKYGAAAFTFQVIEECPDAVKVIQEQFYIDALNSCYNWAPAAGSTLGYKYTEEQRARMSAAQQNNPLAGKHRVGFKESPEVSAARLALARAALAEKPYFWITDGETNIRHPADMLVPSGWTPGRTFSEEHKTNSLAASTGPRSEEIRAAIKAGHADIWDDPEKRQRMMDGRRPFSWYTNGALSKRVRDDETPPEGWWKGRTIDAQALVASRKPREKKPEPIKVVREPKPVIEHIDRRPEAARELLADGEASRRGQKAWDNAESRAKLLASRGDQCWITNGTETVRHSKSQPIPEGWRRGRGGLFGRAAAKAAREDSNPELPF